MKQLILTFAVLLMSLAAFSQDSTFRRITVAGGAFRLITEAGGTLYSGTQQPFDTVSGYVLFADAKRKRDFVRYVRGYQVIPAGYGSVGYSYDPRTYLAYNKAPINANAVILQFIPDNKTVKP